MTNPTTLQRSLKLPSLVIFGLAYLTPLIVIGIFGVIASGTEGGSAGAYLVALLAMLFTAFSYSRMAKAYPVAGSAYTYVRKAIDGRIGFLVGWVTLLDYLFLPMVIWLIGGSYLSEQFPGVPMAVWIIAFIALTSVLNIVGIKVADKVNLALMSFQVLVLVLFVVFAISSVLGAGNSLVSAAPFVGVNGNIALVIGGAAVAAYSFLGFDAVSTLTEETVDPETTVPRAIVLVALIGGGIFVAVSYFVQLAHPGGVFANPNAAGAELAVKLGGSLFSAVFVAALVIAQFTSGIAAQAAGSRLLYAMGRDGVLPRGFFGKLNDKTSTPIFSILTIAVVGLIAIWLDVSTSTSFINFGAFIAFTAVNIAVICYWIRQRRLGNRLSAFAYVVCPIIGALTIVYLLTQLDSNALILGVSWLAIGVIVLAVISRGFREQPAEMSELA